MNLPGTILPQLYNEYHRRISAFTNYRRLIEKKEQRTRNIGSLVFPTMALSAFLYLAGNAWRPAVETRHYQQALNENAGIALQHHEYVRARLLYEEKEDVDSSRATNAPRTAVNDGRQSALQFLMDDAPTEHALVPNKEAAGYLRHHPAVLSDGVLIKVFAPAPNTLQTARCMYDDILVATNGWMVGVHTAEMYDQIALRPRGVLTVDDTCVIEGMTSNRQQFSLDSRSTSGRERTVVTLGDVLSAANPLQISPPSTTMIKGAAATAYAQERLARAKAARAEWVSAAVPVQYDKDAPLENIIVTSDGVAIEDQNDASQRFRYARLPNGLQIRQELGVVFTNVSSVKGHRDPVVFAKDTDGSKMTYVLNLQERATGDLNWHLVNANIESLITRFSGPPLVGDLDGDGRDDLVFWESDDDSRVVTFSGSSGKTTLYQYNTPIRAPVLVPGNGREPTRVAIATERAVYLLETGTADRRILRFRDREITSLGFGTYKTTPVLLLGTNRGSALIGTHWF